MIEILYYSPVMRQVYYYYVNTKNIAKGLLKAYAQGYEIISAKHVSLPASVGLP